MTSIIQKHKMNWIKAIGKMKQMISITTIRNIYYLKAVYLGIFATICQILLMYFLWQVVYSDKPIIEGISLKQMNTYLVLSQAISLQFALSSVDNKIASDIYNGNIIFDLLKPADYKLYLLLHKLGDSIAIMLLRWPFIFAISFFVFGFQLPISLLHFLLFAFSLVTGFFILFYIEFIIGLISFYTLNKYGIRTIKQALLSFLSGTLVPLYFLPDWMKRIVDLMPFKYIVSVPASIYVGIINTEEIVSNFITQFLWIVILAFLANAFYHISIKRITIQGG